MKPGTLLISNPFLDDPNFERSVVIICEHNQKGAFGLVINKQTPFFLADVIEEGADFPLFIGGPVEQNTLHFIHSKGRLLTDGYPLQNGIVWNGDFDLAKQLCKQNLINTNEIRFCLGYSGWEANQLEVEIEEKTWVVIESWNISILDIEPKDLWREVLKMEGGKFAEFANYPTDPRLN